MTRIRVLHLLSSLDIGALAGGAELHALQVARYFEPEEVEPAIFAMWWHDTPVEQVWLAQMAEANIPVWGLIPFTQTGWRSIWQVWRSLKQVVTQFHPHIIHTHSERSDLFNAAIYLFHRYHPTGVRTIHIDQRWRTAPRLGPWLEHYFLPPLFAYECVVSKALQAILLDHNHKPEKVVLCYNGIDAAAFQRSPNNHSPAHLPEGVPQARPRLGVIGRLAEQKGHKFLLEALALIRPQFPTHLLIIGDGPLQFELQTQADHLDLHDFVHFLGIRQDIWDLLATLDLFVLPSLWEGFPTVILEAMSQGIPIIATDVAGSSELVHPGETGLLVPAQNPIALANIILTALQNPEQMQKMAHKARQHAKQYTIQNAAAGYTQIYQSILKKNRLKKPTVPSK